MTITLLFVGNSEIQPCYPYRIFNFMEKRVEIELLSYDSNIIDKIYTACRTCYSSEVPTKIYENATCIDNDKKLNLINKVMKSGHLSTTEHAYFTFAINGVSRSLMGQITRHRLCSFSIQSQRYVEIKENLHDLIIMQVSGSKQEKINLLNKYFVFKDDNQLFIDTFLNALIKYLELINSGYKPEDARDVLPQATKTNIVMSCNLRELIHVCHLRKCKHAQLEIRTMLNKMCEKVVASENCEWLKKYLVPNCAHCTDFRKNECKEIK